MKLIKHGINKRIIEWIISLMVMAAVLIAADLWVERSFGGPPPFETFYRFSGELKPGEFQRQIKSIEGEQGLRIAFLGDSVIRGTSVAESSQTIPAYLQKSINSDLDLRSQGFKVFNFGIAGARDADKYAVLKTLLDQDTVDLLVINVSYPFYSDEILKIPVQFPHVYLDAFSPEEKKELGIGGLLAAADPTESDRGTGAKEGAADNPDQAVAGSKLEMMIVQRLTSNWDLYRYRGDVNQYLFGDQPVRAGRKMLEKLLGRRLAAREEAVTADVEGVSLDWDNLAAKDRPENLIKTYDQFEWEEPEIQHLKKVYQVGPMDDSNIGCRYLKKTLELAEERGVPVVLYLTSVNTRLLDEFSALDREKWQEFTAAVEELGTDRGARVYDFQNSVEARFFHDSLHLVDEGNEQVARMLYQRMKQELMNLAERNTSRERVIK